MILGLLSIVLSDTAAVSIVGIVVSGIAGPWAVARWARARQRADHRHDRRQKRYEDLVALLDSAAEVLAPGASRLRAALEGAAEDPEYIAWSSDVHVTYERLLLRLERGDAVSKAYLLARERLVKVAEALQASAERDEVERLINDFEAARAGYLDKARECLSRESGAK